MHRPWWNTNGVIVRDFGFRGQVTTGLMRTIRHQAQDIPVNERDDGGSPVDCVTDGVGGRVRESLNTDGRRVGSDARHASAQAGIGNPCTRIASQDHPTGTECRGLGTHGGNDEFGTFPDVLPECFVGTWNRNQGRWHDWNGCLPYDCIENVVIRRSRVCMKIVVAECARLCFTLRSHGQKHRFDSKPSSALSAMRQSMTNSSSAFRYPPLLSHPFICATVWLVFG